MRKLFTSESVTEGHPDKMADQISDAILDALLEEDEKSRVAIETLLTNGICIIAGEITTDAYVDMAKIARSVIEEIGYDGCGFHHATSGVMTAIKEQSSDIASARWAGSSNIAISPAPIRTAARSPLTNARWRGPSSRASWWRMKR
jgi:S-adenosylmethionine synthetase